MSNTLTKTPQRLLADAALAALVANTDLAGVITAARIRHWHDATVGTDDLKYTNLLVHAVCNGETTESPGLKRSGQPIFLEFALAVSTVVSIAPPPAELTVPGGATAATARDLYEAIDAAAFAAVLAAAPTLAVTGYSVSGIWYKGEDSLADVPDWYQRHQLYTVTLSRKT